MLHVSTHLLTHTRRAHTQADEFLDLLDGYSIGSNDLTQLVLGVDRYVYVYVYASMQLIK